MQKAQQYGTVSLEKLVVAKLVKKCYTSWYRKFITVFRRARQDPDPV
jgi:hypothetical protein